MFLVSQESLGDHVELYYHNAVVFIENGKTSVHVSARYNNETYLMARYSNVILAKKAIELLHNNYKDNIIVRYAENAFGSERLIGKSLYFQLPDEDFIKEIILKERNTEMEEYNNNVI